MTSLPGAPRPGTPASRIFGIVDRSLATGFGLLARARSRRPIHPRGSSFSAVLTVEPAAGRRYGVPLLDEPAEHRAIVRLSRSVGLPPGWPDISGFAVRLPDVHGPGRHQDLLFTGSGGPPLVRQLVVAARGRPRWYSTISVYDLAGRRRLLGVRRLPPPSETAPGSSARGDASGGITVELCAATRAGSWERLGTLRTREPLTPADAEQLAFDVTVNTGGGLSPYGPVHALRHRSYARAQQVRGVLPGGRRPDVGERAQPPRRV